MRVRWSPLEVSDAMNRVEEHLNNARAPLELAREEAVKAREIPNLPQYVTSRLRSLEVNIQWVIDKPRSDIGMLRRDLPKDQLAEERQRRADQPSLVC